MDSIPIRDIHLPPIPGWWPVAPAWWLALFILLTIIFVGIWLFKKIKHKSTQQLAMKKFLVIKSRYANDQNKTVLLQQISVLLRRICMSYSSRQTIAGLIGKQWIAHINSATNTSCPVLINKQLFIDGPYQKHIDYDANELLLFIQTWIQSLPAEGYKKIDKKNQGSKS